MSNIFKQLATIFSGSPSPEVETFELHGVQVHVRNTRPDIATADVIARLDESLSLINTYQPWRLKHLQHDINGISVERFACRGAFIPDAGVIITELTFLARRDITAAPVASSIVHEGVHARVHATRALIHNIRARATPGIGASELSMRDPAREERLCRRAELAFGRALPLELGAPVIERALASLTLDDSDVAPEIDWREAQRRQDAVDRASNL